MEQIREMFQRVKNGNDVRGVVIPVGDEGVTLTEGMVQYIAEAFLDFLADRTGKKRGELRVGLGHDSRISAGRMKQACFRGVRGARAFDCGLITTPAMFQSTKLPGSAFDGAVMLTASHLPFHRNGMKFFTPDGALSGNELSEILRAAAEAAERDFGSGEADGPERLLPRESSESGIPAEAFDMKKLYCDHMKQLIVQKVGAEDGERPLAGLHIVEDAGNGAAGFFATEILAALGADISGSVFLEPDGHFPNHVPNPENEEAMRAAREATLKAGADLGVIFDCDGDRAAVVFGDGTEVNRNALIALLSVIVAREHPGSWVVTDSVTSDELGEFLEGELGLKHLRFKRGYKNVIDRGRELNREGEECELAIETSGHGAFRENYFSDDGAYIAMKIICLTAELRRENKKIEGLIAGLRSPAEALEKRYKIFAPDFRACGERALEDFRKFVASNERFRPVEPNYEGVRAIYDDGTRRGWVLLRMSLHDPVMPLNAESREAGTLELVSEELKAFFDAHAELRPL